WPRAEDFPRDPAAEAEMDWVRGVVDGVRQIKGEMDIPRADPVPLLLAHAGREDLARLQRHGPLLTLLAPLSSVRALAEHETAPPAATALVGELTLLVPMAGLIEPASELARLDKLVQRNTQELARSRAKLANDQFINNAPSDVVSQERTRLADFERRELALARQIEQVRVLARQGEPVERRGAAGASRPSAEGAP
ncbi:MAG TPA: hypothetical protein VKT19_05795, partial [Steroidobacteraceae bacterium]|nr:hypothetical protein [Steroidobacteraceae bacterium]